MKITKITKFLPIALALALTTSGVYAEEFAADTGATSSTADYVLTLGDYLKITTPTPPGTSAVSYGTDYESAQINTALVGVFKVISNNNSQTIYLKGSCDTSEGPTQAIYGADGDCETMNLVFTNQSAKPSSTAVTAITGNDGAGGSATVESNPNTIAFPMTIVTTHQHGIELTDTGNLPAATWDSNKIKYVMANGVATFTCTVSGNAVPGTFNTRDTDGSYKATLTMTESAT